MSRRCCRAESAETGLTFVLSVAGISVAVATGTLWELAVVYLIPQRIAIGVRTIIGHEPCPC